MRLKITPSPELKTAMLAQLRERYANPREGIHMTECIYCLTRSYWDKVDPLQPTDREVMMWAVGVAVEKVLLKPEQLVNVESRSVDGIQYTPDFFLLGGYNELKSTRAYPKTHETEGLPESWLEQIMGYMWAEGQTEYGLAVLHIIPPDMRAWKITCGQDELDLNWAKIRTRKTLLELYLVNGNLPTPMTYNKSWECGYCRYKMRCETGYGRGVKKEVGNGDNNGNMG